MTRAQTGDTVRIHYLGTLTDGTQFDTSIGGEPLEFRLGAGQIIPGLEKQIDGMTLGARQRLTIGANEAYGDHDPRKVQQVPRGAIPDTIPLERGLQLQAQTSEGIPLNVIVVDFSDQSVTLDGNHPLAGQDLVFDVELVDIVKAA